MYNTGIKFREEKNAGDRAPGKQIDGPCIDSAMFPDLSAVLNLIDEQFLPCPKYHVFTSG
jgi:hypothetical protein